MATSDDNSQQTGVAPQVTMDEVVLSNAPTADEGTKAPTTADTVDDEAQISNTAEGVSDGEQQPESNGTSTHEDTASTPENDHPQEIIEVAEGLDNKTPEEDDDSGTSEAGEEVQASGDVADNADEANDSNAEEDESPPALNTFSMRRTPADMRRFRRDLNLDTEADPSIMARNRWTFAIEATKFQVQIKNLSWEYVRARFAERRLWLDLTVAFWQNLLPSDRIDLMCALTGIYGPSQSRLYEVIANYLNPRGYPFKTYVLLALVYRLC